MSVPARRTPKSKTRRRRSHQALKKQNIARCASCSQPVRPHIACAACGMYRGRTVAAAKRRTRKAPAKKGS